MIESSTDTRHLTKAVTELDALRPVVTTRAIFNAGGIKIVEQGVSVNPGLYERLMQHQLSAPIEDSVASTPSVTSRMLRDGVEELLGDTPLFARLVPDAETRLLLLDTMGKLPLPDPIALQLTLACEVRPALYQHSLCTALVAAWLARVGADPEQLAQLGNESLGEQLQTELTLLAGEATWQLRSLAREAGTGFPEELQEWLDRVVALVFQIAGKLPAEADGDE